MDSFLRLQTNSNLYGPSRTSANTDVKDLLLRDNVLQKGEWDFDSKRHFTWSTTCSNTFKKPLPILYDPQRSAKALSGQRYLTSMVFGNADNLRVATTLKDFDRKWMKTPVKARPDLGTSIPDFASKFMADKKFGRDRSIYFNTYNDIKKVDASKNAGERKQLTKDLRTTHFSLGSTENNYGTETNHIYRPSDSRETNHGPSLATLALKETYQSNVFRDGDWNVTGYPSVRYSVTRNDFHVKPFITEDRAKSNEQISLKGQVYEAMAKKCLSQGIPTATGILQAFTQYDVIKSGYLSTDQVKAVIRSFITLSDDEMDRLIDESDALADGKVNLTTFVCFLGRAQKPKETSEKKDLAITGESYTGTHFMKLSYPDTTSGKPKDNPSHPYYHISTHFQLGDHGEDLRSLYYKDYMMGNKEILRKPFPALPPMSSQVLPEPDRRDTLESTKQADFNDPTEQGKALAQERDRESRKNQTRLSKQSVEISSDPNTAQAYRQSSVSGADYPSPPSEFHPIAPRHAPQSRYRYLDTNGALPVPPADPYLSEQHEKFIPLSDTVGYKDNKVECLDRIGDNRSSHFGFGLETKPKGTEQHHEFSKKPPLDPNLPAAGKVQTSQQNYSHVFPSESSYKESRQPEANLNDVSLLQERLKEMNRIRHGIIPRDPNTTDVRKAFLEFDPDMTGRLSKEDVRKVCRSLKLDIPDSTLQKLFDRCDQDKQGYMNYYQFIKHFTHQLAMTKGRKPSMGSVMKTDYCPPELRRFTPAQQRTIDLAKPTTTMNSHYFHYDLSQERTPSTITRHDFSRPDRLPGEHAQECQKS